MKRGDSREAIVERPVESKAPAQTPLTLPELSTIASRLSPAVVVFAKAPEPGRVKTRLCPPLTLEAAAELQRACLGDLWARLGCLPGIHRILCHHPPQSFGLFRDLLGRETDLLAQKEGGLGQRLLAAFETLFARGWGPLVAVGADSPDLPLALIHRAAQELQADRCDVALGPAADGGYTLIGLSRPSREPFEGIPWSTSEVLTVTRQRCVRAGLRVLSVEPWYDVDDAASLAHLYERVRAQPADFPRLHHFFEGCQLEHWSDCPSSEL